MLSALLLSALSLAPAQSIERPRDIWVFRSVLDRRARIVTIALNRNLWVAYDATNCGLYKSWFGGVKFDGAVYTTAHGPQPTSQGMAYTNGLVDQPVWSLDDGRAQRPLQAEFKGYRFLGNQVQLNYRMRLPNGRYAWVSERPEYASDNGRPVFERQFTVSGLPSGQQLVLKFRESSLSSVDDLSTTGRLTRRQSPSVAADRPTVTIDGELRMQNGTTTLRSRYVAPPSAPTGRQEDELADTYAEDGESPGVAEPEAQGPREPGVSVRIYDVGEPLTKVPMLVSGQTPNVSFVAPVIDFKTDADFRGPKDMFIAHVTGFLNIRRAGTYTFRLTSDDGSIMWINDRDVIVHDGLHGAEGKEGEVDLTVGEHPFRIEYFENGADNVLKLEWREPGSSEFKVVPAEVFTTPAGEVRVTAPGKKRVLPRGTLGRPGDRQPLEGVHPSYRLHNLRPKDFNPRVGGIDFLPDGRMVLCAWEADGGVYLLDNVQGYGYNVSVKRIAAGLAEPLGLTVVDGKIYVLQKQELTQLIDHDGDEVIDEYRAVANGWGVTPNFHEFAFGLVHKDDAFYATLATAIDPGGRSTQPQNIDRGRVIRIRPDGSYQFIAAGLRTPNGIGLGPKNQIFVADNQGDWLPSSKIVLVKEGAFYGNRSVDPVGTKNLPETPPVVWLPQNEIGNSPSQPVEMRDGPYRGQLLHGDVTHGGIKRTFLETVDGQLQGGVFRFTQGLEAGVNRLCWGPDGALYIGGIGSTGNWGQEGKSWYGLQKIKYTGAPTFEMLAVRAKTNGFEIELTEPLAEGVGGDASYYTVESWRYVPTAEYGGPKVDERRLQVRSVTISPDRRRIFLELPMEAGRVVYLRLDPTLPSEAGREIWSTECWYTLNRVPKNQVVRVNAESQRPNVLTPEEQRQGFRLLFDGQTTKGWSGWKKPNVPPAWSVKDGLLVITPGSGAGGDIATVEDFDDFELRLEWRVTPGGNSGIFYRASDKFNIPWDTGPEMQVLDNERHNDGKNPITSAGSNYALYAPTKNVARPAGQWNSVRIVAKGKHVEHWLNGHKIVEYEIESPEWLERVKKSKFANMPNYGRAPSGKIVLQDHGNLVSFRNIRIRKL